MNKFTDYYCDTLKNLLSLAKLVMGRKNKYFSEEMGIETDKVTRKKAGG